MGKRVLLVLAVAVLAMVIVPATAFAAVGLVNEYGMHFAGEKQCVDCHAFFGGTTTDTTHSRMVKPDLVPLPPEPWTVFQSSPGVGEEFNIGENTWITLGDYDGGLITEYLYWVGEAGTNGMPWNLVEGLEYDTPLDEWALADEGLEGVTYGCQRCHQLGTTYEATAGEIVPNPAATIQPTATTPRQWSRAEWILDNGTLRESTPEDFSSMSSLSMPGSDMPVGSGIQCESCHGTGQAASVEEGAHTNTGVQVMTTLEPPEGAAQGLGQSQVCGQCHGSYTNVAGTKGIYGYTPNQPLRNFVDINGLSGGVSYTYIPTEEEFMAAPTKYFMFPNGSNARGNHYYYNEWSATAHSVRPALADDDPDTFVYQQSGRSHYASVLPASLRFSLGCYKCHTGEGYLASKGDPLADESLDFVPTANNVGYMGQECATCHNAHPWKGTPEGVEHDTLRPPDQAGERSAVGLPANQSICEDCHNWQMEVQNTSPNYVVLVDDEGNPDLTEHLVSHPQRETRHNRAIMVDVDMSAAEQFMPGAKCEDCHMPKTNRNVNRYSHGMKIMEPEDAEKWMTAAGPTYRGEDSCSKCHGGETREELQANIDKWQEDTAALAAKAEAAILAVTGDSTPPAEFVLANSSSPGYILIARAEWNWKSWEADASDGVHNPAYIQAGLKKAEMMAKSVGGSFAQLFYSNSVVPGGTGFITGQVKNGDGSGAAGASVKLSSGPATMADAAGNFAFMIKPGDTDGTSTAYTVTWARSGDSRTNLSKSITVKVAKRSSTTTIAASAATITYSKTVKLSGKVSPSAAGQSVKIQYRRSTSQSWKSLKTLTLNSSSQYSYSYKPTAKGAWYFRALYSGTSTVASSNSSSVKVTVK